MLKSRSARLMLCGLLLAVFTLPALAQSNVDGAVVGTVTDPSNAVIAGATVTARSNETNAQVSSTSDSAGGFRIIHLQPGLYTVTASSGSFAPFKAVNVIVEVGRLTPLDVRLKVAGREEQVEVTGEAPVINTTQGEISTNINQTSMSELPVNARRWSAFAAGTPGASPDGGFGLLAFRGISGLLNNNTVDGGDNNNAYFSEERGRTRATSVIGQDSIREYQVNASNFSAEYGRAAGAVVNAVTKSGTNGLHGSGFLFATDSDLWAKNPFSLASSVVGGVLTASVIKPPDRRWQFGGNVGGPIVKDKLFFFFNWDQQRENAPGIAAPDPRFLTPITVAKPTNCNAFSASTNPGGISSAFPGQTLWCRGVANAGTAFTTPAAAIAAPATPGVTQAQSDAAMGFLTGLTGTVARRKDQYVLFPKVDWHVNDRNTVTGSWNHMRWTSPGGIQSAAVVSRGVASWGDDFVQVDTVNARLTSLLSNTMTNEFRASFGVEDQFENSNPPGPGEPSTGKGGRPPAATIARPGLTGAGSFVIGKANFLERLHLPREKRQQYTDIMSWSHGNHMVKWGFDYNRSHDLVDNLFQEGGDYSYSNIEDFITDVARPNGACGSAGNIPCYNSFTQGVGPTAFQFATNDYSGFVQDDWHMFRHLTVNLGLRYEYEKIPPSIFPNAALPVTLTTPKDPTDFGPRMGAAWDMFGNGKTVLRGGYGMFYGRIINAYIGPDLTVTGAANSQLSTGTLKPCLIGSAGCLSPAYPNVLSAAVAGTSPPAVDVWGGTVKAPRVHEVDLTLEHQIARNTVISASYLMSMGRRLPLTIDRNLPPAPTGTITYTASGGPDNGDSITLPLYGKLSLAAGNNGRPNPAFAQIYNLEYIGVSRYDGLVLSLNRRMSDGLQVQASFTHARATDQNQHRGTGPSGNDPFDPNNLGLERGTSAFDIRNKFGMSAVYQPTVKNWGPVARALINGFSIAPIWSWSSGAPLQLGVSGTPSTIAAAPAALQPVSTNLIGVGGACGRDPRFRNSLLAPATASANLRVARKFRIHESMEAEFMAEVFNITNHMNFTSTTTTEYTVGGTTFTPATGILSGVLTYANPGVNTGGNDQDRAGFTPRQWQFGARFRF